MSIIEDYAAVRRRIKELEGNKSLEAPDAPCPKCGMLRGNARCHWCPPEPQEVIDG